MFSGCDKDPEPENIPEMITRVVLTFTPAGAAPIVAEANDPDGDGPQDIEIEPIVLNANTDYTLTIQLYNGLYEPTDPEYNITEEVEEEGDEHQFFFGWSAGLFTSPTGTGNIGAAGTVNYADEDAGGLPIGLTTTWTTGTATSDKSFRVILKHQPDIKSVTSTSADGESDLDVTFPISIN
ncbi:MAG: hypothetical protein KIT62_15360 [Cyclobacteriaceae bacterium]|nr:hypothetical protein [Cyclobacteriaceae bacterium]